MSSRDDILKAIRSHRAPEAPLSDLKHDWIRYADPFAQFKSLVESVGGQCVRVSGPEQVATYLESLPAFATARRVYSTVPGVTSNVDLDQIDDPHELESVDWAVLPGQFGVAENGAIWVTDEKIRHRVIYFIVQHLALVLPADQIVHNLHEAYERIVPGQSSLGLFISGPSKTADIEQSLVIGAHGPRSLTVLCVDR